MPILSIDNEHYRYGTEPVIDASRQVTGYMGFMAPATTPSGNITTVACMTGVIPPSPLVESEPDAETYIFNYIVLNHRRQSDGTGFPAGSRIGILPTGQFGNVAQPEGSVSIGHLTVELDDGTTQSISESDLVLVPEV